MFQYWYDIGRYYSRKIDFQKNRAKFVSTHFEKGKSQNCFCLIIRSSKEWCVSIYYPPLAPLRGATKQEENIFHVPSVLFAVSKRNRIKCEGTLAKNRSPSSVSPNTKSEPSDPVN